MGLKKWFTRFLIIWAVQVAWNLGFALFTMGHVHTYNPFYNPSWGIQTMLTSAILGVIVGSLIASATKQGLLKVVLILQCIFNLVYDVWETSRIDAIKKQWGDTAPRLTINYG